MALLDLGAVTRTLMKVIDLSVNASPGWPPLPSPALAVSPLPPDKLTGDPQASLYLYHISEDAAFKNTPPLPGSSGVRFTPMGLNLFYVLTAHSGESDAGTLTEQLIMGLAIKALRDHPILDDDTKIGGTPVLDPSIQHARNRVRISLQPVPPAEAVSYWTAGSAPLRLAAYYQVSVVLLEPDEPVAYAARVLRYGVQVFTGGPPLLDASQSVVAYRLPGDTSDRTAIAQPAQVTQLAPGDQFTLLGSGIVGGKIALLLRPGGAETPLVADAGWSVQPTSLGVMARAQATASGTPVAPGLYGASVRIDRTVTLPDGTSRLIAQTSNEVPLTIAPGVSALSTPDAAGNFTITGTGFTPPASVVLIMGEDKAVAGTLPLNAGAFAVSSATSIDARLPAGLASGAIVPVRVMVSGAEAPPQWVVAR